jgi:hypothetical protein
MSATEYVCLAREPKPKIPCRLIYPTTVYTKYYYQVVVLVSFVNNGTSMTGTQMVNRALTKGRDSFLRRYCSTAVSYNPGCLHGKSYISCLQYTVILVHCTPSTGVRYTCSWYVLPAEKNSVRFHIYIRILMIIIFCY